MADNRLFPLATALRHGLKHYSKNDFRHDLAAGLVVSLVALPLSMALSIAVGLPPQHGLYTAIVAGIVAAVLGGSATQVSGPTAAFVVIVAPIVTDLGLHGIIWCQILAGFFLICLGVFRLGRLVDYVPHAVTTGFTAGIAVTIATLSLNDFFGLHIEKLGEHYIDKASAIIGNMPNLAWNELAVGATSLLGIVFFPRVTKIIPASVAGIALGTAVAWILSKTGSPVETLYTRFSYDLPDGGTGQGIPPYPPVFHLPGSDGTLFKIPDIAELKILLKPALVIAALGALESLLSATVADSMTKTKHNPDAELNGIGVANICSGLVAGIPATGALARTAANIHAGAKTPLAAVIHALFILFYMMAFAPYISHVPMAALAALLLTVAWRMSHAHEFIAIARKHATKERILLVATFILTVLIDMVAGVSAGMILAGLFHVHDHHGKRHKVSKEDRESDN